MSAPAHPLGIVLSTVTDAAAGELVDLGRQAEARGFASVYVNEGRGDSLACAEAIALATGRITVGTNITNIHFRHPYLTAQSARTIAELSGGRFVLGLGMSHRGLLRSLGIDMGDARAALRDHVRFVTEALAGRAAAGFLAPPPSRHPVPVYVAGNTVESAALAGRLGAGLMPFLTPRRHLPTLIEAARAAGRETGRDMDGFGVILSIPTFLSPHGDAARSAARYNLAFFSQLPNYRRQWRRAGFRTAMDRLQAIWRRGGDRHAAAAAIPDELVDEVCVLGDADACRAQLAAFHAAGADEPVIAVSPVDEDRLQATRRAIDALAAA